jgi:Amt family ammonium transporter
MKGPSALKRLFILSFLALGLVLSLAACAPGPQEDASGLTTGADPKALVGVAPANLSNDDFSSATNEPFALKLASQVNENRIAINFVWTLVTGYLVMFMQVGFALVETGFTRAKNAAHTMSMNFAIYVLGMLGYYICGFAFMFGGVGLVGVGNLGGLSFLDSALKIGDWRILGTKGFFMNGAYDVGAAVLFLFEMVFMDTTATIPTGAMAERWNWKSFVIYGFFVGGVIYPIYGMWAWGGGWLSQLGNIGLGAGYADFAGSGVVHAIGGWTALAGSIVLGPRLGRYNKDGSANPAPGHSIVLAIVGTMILGFGWFGFNPGSTLGASGNGALRIGIVAVDTMLASATGAFIAMLYMWWFGPSRKPDPGMICNGFLAGLVAITAPSGFVSPLSSVIIGAISGVLVCLSVAFFDKIHVDDPVGAISVHGVNGLWGQIAVGLFADGTMNYGGWVVKGVIFNGDWGQLVAQLIGGVAAFVWAFGISWLFFKVLDMTMGLRVPAEVELKGLDIPEMGVLAYPADWKPKAA